MVEITASEQNIEKRMKRNEDSLRDLWDNIKWTNIHIIGVPEGKGREKGPEKIFEEIRAENFPNIGKERFNQVQEAQKVPGRINLRRNTPRHIVIKMTKIKDKDKILKATREKQQITYKGTPIMLSADFSTETLQARRVYLKWWKGRNYNQEHSTQQDSHSDLMEKSKAFPTSKFKRIQHYEPSFKMNAKGTSLGRK